MSNKAESWAVWKLAPESDPQERLIITTADGDTEITGIVYDPQHAQMIAALPGVFAAAAKVVASWEGVNGGLAPAIRELKKALGAHND
jgi:hypothetical protein